MFYARPIIPEKLAVFSAAPPFHPDQVLKFQTAVLAGSHAGIRINTPMIYDYTRINLAELPKSDVAHFVMKRRSLTEEPQAGPLAMVCSDLATFGMLRMFGIVAELSDLRPEDKTWVTMQPVEALTWIAGQADLTASELATAADALRDMLGWHDLVA